MNSRECSRCGSTHYQDRPICSECVDAACVSLKPKPSKRCHPYGSRRTADMMENEHETTYGPGPDCENGVRILEEVGN